MIGLDNPKITLKVVDKESGFIETITRRPVITQGYAKVWYRRALHSIRDSAEYGDYILISVRVAS